MQNASDVWTLSDILAFIPGSYLLSRVLFLILRQCEVKRKVKPCKHGATVVTVLVLMVVVTLMVVTVLVVVTVMVVEILGIMAVSPLEFGDTRVFVGICGFFFLIVGGQNRFGIGNLHWPSFFLAFQTFLLFLFLLLLLLLFPGSNLKSSQLLKLIRDWVKEASWRKNLFFLKQWR